jgi:hypothetical protein
MASSLSSITLEQFKNWIVGTTIEYDSTEIREIKRAEINDGKITVYSMDNKQFEIEDISKVKCTSKVFVNQYNLLPNFLYTLSVGDNLNYKSNDGEFNGNVIEIKPSDDGNTQIILSPEHSFIIKNNHTSFSNINITTQQRIVSFLATNKYLKYKHKYLRLKQLLK